jgi:hypothetical protein
MIISMVSVAISSRRREKQIGNKMMDDDAMMTRLTSSVVGYGYGLSLLSSGDFRFRVTFVFSFMSRFRDLPSTTTMTLIRFDSYTSPRFLS